MNFRLHEKKTCGSVRVPPPPLLSTPTILSIERYLKIERGVIARGGIYFQLILHRPWEKGDCKRVWIS